MKFNIGDTVKATDQGKNNYGIITAIPTDLEDPNAPKEYLVFFKNNESGQSATVRIKEEDLILEKAGPRKEHLKLNESGSTIERLADKMDRVTRAANESSLSGLLRAKDEGKDFYVSFAGFDKYGERAESPSTYIGSIDSWIEKEGKKPDTQWLDHDNSFVPGNSLEVTVRNIASDKDEKIQFPYGVIAVFGETGAGKSKFISEIVSRSKCRFIRFGEPEIPSLHEPERLLEEFDTFINTDKYGDVMAADSFRPFLFMSTKKATVGRGGINNSLYRDFTALSSICTMAKRTLFVVINPLEVNKDTVANVKSNVESSVMGLVHCESYGRFSYVARTLDSQRTANQYAIAIGGNKIVQTAVIENKKDISEAMNEGEIEIVDQDISSWSRFAAELQK